MTRYYGQPILVELTEPTPSSSTTADTPLFGSSRNDSRQTTPKRFLWQGRHYRVMEVLKTWHLRDRWWHAKSSTLEADVLDAAESSESEAEAFGGVKADVVESGETSTSLNSNRFYYFLRCVNESSNATVFCELYFDADHQRWIFDRLYD